MPGRICQCWWFVARPGITDDDRCRWAATECSCWSPLLGSSLAMFARQISGAGQLFLDDVGSEGIIEHPGAQVPWQELAERDLCLP